MVFYFQPFFTVKMFQMVYYTINKLFLKLICVQSNMTLIDKVINGNKFYQTWGEL